MSKTKSSPDQVTNDLFRNVKSANGGDKVAMAELRKELAGPNANAIISVCGDMSFQAEESLLVAILGQQEGAKTCVREKMRQMRVELGWTESSEMERILIERIIATWLDLYFAEVVYYQWKGGSIPEGKYKQYRIDRSHRRHLSAIKMLATIRKMALPLMVNIAAEIKMTEARANESKQPLAKDALMNCPEKCKLDYLRLTT